MGGSAKQPGKTSGVEAGVGEVHFPKRITDQALEPGKATNTQGLLAGPAASGGGALNKPDPYKTGHDYADKGAACEGGGPDCFLEPEQRQRVIEVYQGRVNAALTQYLSALTELGVEELLKKEEDSDWLFELLLDVIGSVALKGAMKVFGALKEGGAVNAITEAVSNTGIVEKAMLKVEDKQVEAALKKGIDVGRKALPKKPTKSDVTKKDLNLSYIDLLKINAGSLYEHLRESALAGAGDSGLVSMMGAFQASQGHMAAHYKVAIQERIDRFHKTGVAKIGITKKQRSDKEIQNNEDNRVQQKAFWVTTPFGRRLALYERRHVATVPEKVDEYYNGPVLGASKAAPDEMGKRDLDGHPFKFKSYVPVDFTEHAVQIHTAFWSEEPIEHEAGPIETAQAINEIAHRAFGR